MAIPSELMENELFGHKKGSFTGAHADKDGLFQAANGGTLFLDEVAELPLHLQVKLLRVIRLPRIVADSVAPGNVAAAAPVSARPTFDGGLPEALEQIERETIQKALEACRYNKTKAAVQLGITFRALRYKLKKLEME